MITYAYREHLYASVADLYGGGHLPDTICALALATSGVGVPVLAAADVDPETMRQIWAEAKAAGEPIDGHNEQLRPRRGWRHGVRLWREG